MELTIEVPAFGVKKLDGRLEKLDLRKILATLERAGVEAEAVSVKTIVKETFKS